MNIIQETYQIIHEIGSGSGGTVYLAYHKRLKKKVVIKQMKAIAVKVLDNRAETDILKNLRHSYLPQVLDFVWDKDEAGNEVICTVMDYIPGKTFDELLKEGRTFTPVQVMKYMKQLCEAVDYLHSQSSPIIHGDIKPANIMLTPDDDICLIDFNISGYLDNLEIMGFTKGYAAPEQILAVKANDARKKHKETYQKDFSDETVLLDDGTTLLDDKGREILQNKKSRNKGKAYQKGVTPVSTNTIDVRVDIYSIGATMYKLLTGHVPAVDNEKQVSIEDEDIKISEGMAFLIDKCIRYKAEERFQSVKEMLNAMKTMGKKDRRYKRLVRRQIAVIVLFIFMTACCTVVSYVGFGKMKTERGTLLYNTSLELYEKRAYDEALEYILKEALDDERLYDKGMLGNLYYLAGQCSFETEQYKAAADFYKTSLIYNYHEQEAYCNYAISLARLGKVEEALDVINMAIQKGVEEEQIYLMKGELSAAKNDVEEAINNYAACIEHTENPYVMMRAYVMYSDFYVLREGYANNSEYIESNINLLNKAKTAVSEEYLSIILERLINANCAMGDLTEDVIYYKQAIQNSEEMVNKGWGTFEIHMNLASLYSDLGDFNNSHEVYLNILDRYGDNYIIYKKMAFLELDIQSARDVKKRNYKQFLAYYQKSLELFGLTGKQLDEDMEMGLLENTYDTLRAGGWL